MNFPTQKRKPKGIKFPNINYDSLLSCLDLENLFSIHPLELAHYIDMALTYVNAGVSSINIPFDSEPFAFTQDTKGPLKNIINRLHEFSKRRDSGNKYFKEPYLITLAMTDKHKSMQVMVERLPDDSNFKTLQLCITKIETHDKGSVHNAYIPLQWIIKNSNIKPKLYMGYEHTITHLNEYNEMEEWKYAGITGRQWTTRLKEHLSESVRGSQKTFHKILNESLTEGHTIFDYELCIVNKTYDEIMHWEEKAVDAIMDEPNIKCANMIYGGFKGIRMLHQHRKLGENRPSLIERENAIASYLKENPRAGLPNQVIAKLWESNPSYAESVICNQPNRLSANAIRQIRALSKSNMSVAQICEKLNIGCKRKVLNVISGKTYSRIA